MVTRSGFQSGAVKYANAHGILLYELFEAPPRPPLVVKAGSFGTMALKFEPARKGFPPRFTGIYGLTLSLNIKILNINSVAANLTIIQHEPIEREMKTVGFVDFILRNLQDGTDQTISIEEARTS